MSKLSPLPEPAHAALFPDIEKLGYLPGDGQWDADSQHASSTIKDHVFVQGEYPWSRCAQCHLARAAHQYQDVSVEQPLP